MALWFEAALLPEGWRSGVRIAVEDGRIAGVTAGSRPESGDERHGAALPGMPNLHSHTFQRAMAGLTELSGPGPDSFWTWRETMYRFLDRLDPDDVEAIAALAFVEMLEGGFTRVGEFHYLHHDRDGTRYADPAELSARIAAAADETGIGLTLLPVFYAHGGFGGLDPQPGQRRFVTAPDEYASLVAGARRATRTLPDAVVGVAPHSLRAVTPDELRAVLALEPDGPVHIHVAEQTREVEESLAWSGARPVRWLLDHHALGARWCLVHATHVDGGELADLAASGAVAGLCPVTEANLGDGLFPAAEYVAAGGRFGVGSDSNVRIDLAGELSLLEYGQRLHRRARNVLSSGAGASTGRSVFDAARGGGALALGAGPAELAVGASADIVALHDVAGTGDAALDRWIFGSARSPVATVWRRGRAVVRDGRHIARDDVAARFRAVLARVVVG